MIFKGSSFLRMIEKLIGEESFDKALRWYLFENQYGNTNEQDLYKAFELFMPSGLLGPDGNRLDIPEFARCWTDQNGYPTVHVTVASNNTIRLTQQMDQFLKEGHQNKGVCGYRWDIPIWYQHGANAEVEFTWFGRNEQSVELAIETPVIINLNSDGFYKVSYSNKLFSKQAAALIEAIKVKTRYIRKRCYFYRTLQTAPSTVCSPIRCTLPRKKKTTGKMFWCFPRH